MRTLRVVVASLALFTLGAPGFIGGIDFAYGEEDVRSQGPEFQAGYHRGYEYGYQHGYHDALSGLEYENHRHGYEGAGPFNAGMREGEHAGYERGFREGRERSHHHHHHGDDEVH
jgi:hypothetical protein